MFNQTFVDVPAEPRSPWSMAVSLVVQTGLVALLVLIPLVHPEGPLLKVEAPPIIYRANPLPPPEVKLERTISRVVSRISATLLAPRTVPEKIANIVDPPQSFRPVMPGSTMPGAIETDIASMVSVLPQPPAPRPATPPKAETVPTPAPTAPVRVSTSIQAAALIFGPKPVYPPLGRAARVQGTVRITAIIAANGNIKELRVISGPPLLVTAAMEAVSRWRYRPTMLNGTAVEVITEVDVNFILGQ